MTENIFAKYQAEAYPYRYEATFLIRNIAGGTPNDPDIIKKFIDTKVSGSDERRAKLVAEVLADRIQAGEASTKEEAVELAAEQWSVNGFKSDSEGLYIEGRQLKACIKEAASIAMAAGKLPRRWGNTHKGIVNYVAEHIFVEEDKLHLGVTEPTGTSRSFIHVRTPQGPRDSIKLVDYVEEAKVSATIATDHEFSEREWAMVWLTAGNNGLGADRSQGFGLFDVIEWKQV